MMSITGFNNNWKAAVAFAIFGLWSFHQNQHNANVSHGEATESKDIAVSRKPRETVYPEDHIQTTVVVTNSKNVVPLQPRVTVEPEDYIYSTRLGAAPIVIENHKLIFFYVPKVGCSIWKRLFRRMTGYADWKTKSPHSSTTNGLTYLYHYNVSTATQMINSPEYTKAIFLRDPKERFLSAYLDKSLHDNGSYIVGACCKTKGGCSEKAREFSGFLELTLRCLDTHWRPQSKRMEQKYIPMLDFIGHFETMEKDAKKLLERAGGWNDFGRSGWGRHGNESIFATSSDVKHATSNGTNDSWSRLSKYYTPEIEQAVEEMYDSDYTISEFKLARKKIFVESSGKRR
jgi:hypothetical protein